MLQKGPCVVEGTSTLNLLIPDLKKDLMFEQHMFKLCIERFKYGQYQGSPMLAKQWHQKEFVLQKGQKIGILLINLNM